VASGPRIDVAFLRGFDLPPDAAAKEKLLLVLGTSSSEAASPGLMAKLEAAGCSRSVVWLVVPTGFPSTSAEQHLCEERSTVHRSDDRHASRLKITFC